MSLSELRKWLEDDNKNNIIYIAKHKQATVGLIELRNINWISRSAWLYLYADSNLELEQLIISSACNLGISLNLRKLTIDVVLKDNSLRIKFLEKNGFKIEIRKRQAHFAGGSFGTVLEMSAYIGNSNERIIN